MEPRTFLYRTQIHRRTLLGSGALVGLGPYLLRVVSRLIMRR